MTVSFIKHVALVIPEKDVDQAMKFYTDFGLEGRSENGLLSFRCDGRLYDSLHLVPAGDKKKLHHVSMGTTEEGLAGVRQNAEKHGYELVDAPEGFSKAGIWLYDMHGMLFNVEVCQSEAEVAPEEPFLINSPGYYNRINAGAMLPKSQIADVRPRKLGHTLLFTPDVNASIDFLINVLGMCLADRAKDVVAFTYCQGGSDHHVIALVKSSGPGLHHASFMLATPDEVGLGGMRMIEKGHEKGWGFGRHAIGSNYFHYTRDPWGSYVEYYADIDYIADSDNWEPKDWPSEDALYTWGPNPPEDFIKNYEMED